MGVLNQARNSKNPTKHSQPR